MGLLRSNRVALLLGALALWVGPCAVSPALARVDITLDAATLTKFLQAATPPQIDLPLPSGTGLAIQIRDVKVTGFDPAAGKNGRGQILTSLRLAIPALGIDLPLQPRVAIDVDEDGDGKICVLRFEKMEIPLAVTGPLDVSVLVPPARVRAEGEWLLGLRTGNLDVKARLVETRMGAEALRLGFDVDLAPQAAKVASPAAPARP